MTSSISKKPNQIPKQKLIMPKRCEEDSALLILLKKYSLQQYYKGLAEKGYDQNLKALIALSDLELQNVLDTMHFFPGHRSKFVSIISLLRKLQIKDTPRRRVSSCNRSNSKDKPKRPISCKNKGLTNRPAFKKMFKNDQHIECKSKSDRHRYDLEYELKEAKKKIEELKNQLADSLASPTKAYSFDPFEELPDISNESPELGVSYDSSKMRSTLHYLDIEEICKCLSRFIRKMIIEKIKPKGYHSSLNSSRSDTTEHSESAHEEIPLGILELFNERFFDPLSKPGIIPCEEEIYNISKNIIIRSKMEKECSIICLIYIERLKNITGISPTERN